MGIAQFFVAEFKSSAILPSDLLALGTALSVSGGYSFVLSVQLLIALSLAAVAVSLLSLMRPMPRPAELGKRPRVLLTSARIVAGCVMIALVGALSHTVSLCRDFGLQESFWDALGVYRSQGFAASFASLIPVSYTHLRAHETGRNLVCRLLLEKKKRQQQQGLTDMNTKYNNVMKE